VNPAHARRLLFAAALLGFVLRAAFGLIYWQDRPLTHDEREYLALAANVAAGRGFAQDLPNEPHEGDGDIQRFGRAPLYPLFLAPIVAFNPALRDGRLPDDVPDAVKVAQSIVGAIAVWLLGAIAWRVGGERMGVNAAGIAAIYPPLVWICAYALSEALFATLALACVWWLMPALDASSPEGERGAGGERGRLFPLFIGGALVGLAVLTRPAMLFFLPFALLLGWRRRTIFAAAMLAGTLAVVLPWTARNAAVYGRFVLVASEGGVTFWTGNHREARGEGDLAANPHLKQLNREFRARHRGLTEEELEPIYYREALNFIAEAPGRWLGLLAKKLFYTWVPIGPSYRLHSPRYFWTSVVAYGALLPVAVVGFSILWRSGRRPWTLWALAGSTIVVALLFFPQERFRIPVIDPTLILCAAAALTPMLSPAMGARRLS
jgi:4-amino-4-deoxy-L-arabinose transferase-like glycosyltransferase